MRSPHRASWAGEPRGAGREPGAGQESCKHQAWRYLQRAEPQHPAQELDLLPSPPCLPSQRRR